MRLPLGMTAIGSGAFSGSGVKFIEIPDKVASVEGDAFAYCNDLTTVIIGKSVKTMGQGVFYGSGNITNAYVKPLVPPTLNGVTDYLFSGKNRIIHVYPSAVDAYKAAAWDRFGTIVGDLTDEIIDGIEEISESSDYSEFSEDSDNSNPSTCFDLMGRKVIELKPGTIYIRGGKKFMLRQ